MVHGVSEIKVSYNDSITTGSSTQANWTYPYTNTIYLYQIKCPKSSCKKMNWLKLDTITGCINCGAKLKAVSEQAEYEIEVEG